MSVQPLLAQLKQDAAQEVQRRIDAARQEAAQLLALEADDDARDLDRALAEHERVLRQALDRHRDDVVRVCHLETLESRRRLVARVLRTGKERLDGLVRHPRFAAAQRTLLERALAYLPPGTHTVRCHPALIEIMRQSVTRDSGTAPTIESDQALDFGFLAQSADGDVRVDATYSPMLQRAQRILAMRMVAAHASGEARDD